MREGEVGAAGLRLAATAREAERRTKASAARWKMAVCRVSTPPIPEVSCPVAENWCYTQVLFYTIFHAYTDCPLFKLSLAQDGEITFLKHEGD